MIDQTDIETCLKSLEQGDAAVLARLFDHYRPRLVKAVSLYMDPGLRRRAEAADVLQEAYVDAAQQIDNYIGRRERENVDFYLWLRGITMQRLSKFHRFHLRTQRRTISSEVALPDRSSLLLGQQLISRGSSPSEHLRKEELRKQVQGAVQNLADSDREVIMMRHFEGLTNNEVAQSLGLETSTATMRYGRAIARLRAALLECDAMGGSSL